MRSRLGQVRTVFLSFEEYVPRTASLLVLGFDVTYDNSSYSDKNYRRGQEYVPFRQSCATAWAIVTLMAQTPNNDGDVFRRNENDATLSSVGELLIDDPFGF